MRPTRAVAIALVTLLAASHPVRAGDHNCAAERGVCLHGGICSDPLVLGPNNPGANGNGWSQPQCICRAPWGGRDCSFRIRECFDSPCQNGGTCAAATCRQANRAFADYDCFTCTCPRGWTGAPVYQTTGFNPGGLCDWPQVVNDCSANPCQNGGTCTYDAPTNQYSCQCAPSYSGQNCTDVFNCLAGQTCQNGGTCVVDGNGVGAQCVCDGFYGGNRCQTLHCASSPCQNGGTCYNQPGGVGACACTDAWTGDFCERPAFCATNPCRNGGVCVPGALGTGHCACPSPYDGQLSCNATLFCASSPCQNGARCVNTTSLQGGSGLCVDCPAGFRGDLCEIPLVGCAKAGCAVAHSRPAGTGPALCRCTDKQSCTAEGGGFGDTRCTCQNGPEDDHPTWGYHYDCRCNSTYRPRCPNPRSISVASVNVIPVTGAMVDAVCQNGGTCVEWAEGWGCTCRPGFWGDRCQSYDNPCWNEPCQNGGRCAITQDIVSADRLMFDDRYWGYFCNCRWPFYGKNCELRTEVPVVCPENACQNGGTCVPRQYSTSGAFTQSVGAVSLVAPPYRCLCADGWYGIYCELPVERCACQNGGFCLPSSTSFTCNCPCGYAGPRCEYRATNVDPLSVALFASDGRGGVGYRLEFCSLGMCQNGADCVHTVDGQGFSCQCRSGWSGLLCTTRVRSAAAAVTPVLASIAALVVAAVVGARGLLTA